MKTRFAPSPSGWLHLGHAHSALAAWEAAAGQQNQFILRIEDIDITRCKRVFEDAIYEDVAWLGLSWCEPVMRQSDRKQAYETALQTLRDQDLVYPCFCTRREIEHEIAQSVSAPHGPDGFLYPGICRSLTATERAAKITDGVPHAWRLDASRATALTGNLHWHDRHQGRVEVDASLSGDVIIARKDIGVSYHLAVVIDDAEQGITLVTRGQDLFHATHVHRLLQELLKLPVPEWNHHALIKGSDGKRLAKRSDAESIRSFREAGHSPMEVRRMAGF